MSNKKVIDPDDEDFIEQDLQKPALGHPSYEELSAQLVAMETKANENWDKLLRCQAEIENLRYRSARDLNQSRKFALENFVRELLPVVDNLERALEQKNDTKVTDLFTGVELTLKLLQSTLEKHDVKPVNPLNEAFDPTLHEAMSMQEDAEKAPGTVLMVLQKGYLLHDRLLRPALVVVSKAPEK
jgi:molecular chaperone GrpE